MRADAAEYYCYAYNLRHHQVYSRDSLGLEGNGLDIKPDAIRNPGYPLFLSVFVDGPPADNTFNPILFAQVLISTFTVVISYCLCTRYLRPGWAGFAAFLTSVSPHLVIMNIYLLTETLFCFALCVVAWAFNLLTHRPVLSRSLILGVILGLGNLVRPSLLYFLLPLLVLIIWQLKHRRRSQLALLVIFGFAIVMVPWHIRNLVTLERWSDDTLQINFLHHGIYPNFIYNGMKESYGFPYQSDPRSPGISQSTGTVLKEIVARFHNQPSEHLAWYLLNKPKAFWSWDIVQGQGDVIVYSVSKTPYWDHPFFLASHGIMRILHGPLVLSGLLGCVMAWLPLAARFIRSNGVTAARFTSLLLIYFTALHMIGFPEPRYGIPLRPFLYGMSVFAVGLIWAHIKSRWKASDNRPADSVQGDSYQA